VAMSVGVARVVARAVEVLALVVAAMVVVRVAAAVAAAAVAMVVVVGSQDRTSRCTFDFHRTSQRRTSC
jgi:hypothetical protein